MLVMHQQNLKEARLMRKEFKAQQKAMKQPRTVYEVKINICTAYVVPFVSLFAAFLIIKRAISMF